MTSSTPVVVSTFRSLADALLAQGLLESAGVGSRNVGPTMAVACTHPSAARR